MDTIITRDSDVIREYLTVLDARERGLSPFGWLTATVKLSRLRYELQKTHIETTDEDLSALKSEVEERLSKSLPRRIVSRSWGARLVAFLIIIAGSQIALGLTLLVTGLFVKFAPRPFWWNKILPRDEPAFLIAFVFLFFFATPMTSLLVVYGGRYFRSWQATAPATIGLIVISALGVYQVVAGKPNPIVRHSSEATLARERGVNLTTYQQWVEGKWLLNDPKFQADYERYLRSGPGRWITARVGPGDASWQGATTLMSQYLDGGQDPNGFRSWLKYYLDRNRIYSEDRIDQEVNAFAGGDRRYLGIWEVEPFLKERDRRVYRAYLGSISHSMKLWGLAEMGLLILVFVLWTLLSPIIRSVTSGTTRLGLQGQGRSDGAGGGQPSRPGYHWFPEQREITTPPFFETPFRLLGRVHRSYISVAISTIVFVFVLYGVIFALGLGSTRGGSNPSSQTSLMRRYILGGSEPSATEDEASGEGDTSSISTDSSTLNYGVAAAGPLGVGVAPLGGLQSIPVLERELAAIQQRFDDDDYEKSKKLSAQEKLLATQAAELDYLRNQTAQLQQTTAPLGQQVQDVTSRTGAVEERASQALGELTSTKALLDNVDKTLNAKVEGVDAKATRASEGIGVLDDRTSTLATRTDALEKELDRRAHQIEAQTEELGNRTAALKDREEKLDHVQRLALTTIISDLRSQTEGQERRVRSAFYRAFYKKEARRDAGSLLQRIDQLSSGLAEMKSADVSPYVEQLQELRKRIEQVSARVK